MHTDEKADPLVDLGYEQKDIAPKIIFKASMIFFGFALASWGVVYFFMHLLGYLDTVPNVNNLMSTKTPAAPNPILQTNITAKTDIRELRKHENDILATGGDSEYTPGFKRVSIEQAIKLVADRHGKVSVGVPNESKPLDVSIRKPASNAPQQPATGGTH